MIRRQGVARALCALTLVAVSPAALLRPAQAQSEQNPAAQNPAALGPGEGSSGNSDAPAQLEARTRLTESFRPPLQPLPPLPSRRPVKPSTEDLELVNSLLERITSADLATRQSALADLGDVTEALLPAVRARIDAEADKANRGEMKRVLLDIRRQTRDELERQQRAAGQSGELSTPDYLEMLVGHPRLQSSDWKQMVRVLTLSRICVRIASVASVRELIHVFVRFEFLRIDTQLQLRLLDEKALAALIETTRHPAPAVAEWAKRRLDFMGRAIPSEAIRVNSPEVLADILRAYGTLKDPDAARLVLSFASSERSQVRLAARQAIAGYGDSAIWVLRDAYEQTVGEKASREWSWDRLARELFREFDRNRLAEVYALYEAGLQAAEAQKLSDAVNDFQQLLNRSPDFEPKEKIVSTLLAFAESEPEQEKNWDAIELALYRVLRLGTTDDQRNAKSLLLTVQARRLAARGVADQYLLRQALELNSKNQSARLLLSELETPPLAERSEFQRWLWPSVLSGMSVLFLGLVVWGRRKAL